MAPQELLTTGQIANEYGIERTTVYRWAKSGKLAVAQNANGIRLIKRSVVERFLAERAEQAS